MPSNLGPVLRKATSSRVAQPNTPESDLEPEVMHIVRGKEPDGTDWEVLLMASDPMTALDSVATMPEGAFKALLRTAASAI